MPVLYIVRGLPGSGKSTLAKKLVPSEYIREDDMYHIVDGVYEFKPENVPVAHEWCKNEIKQLLASGENVAVANTFTREMEYAPYIKMAEDAGYAHMTIDCYGNWGTAPRVPLARLQVMENLFEGHFVTDHTPRYRLWKTYLKATS